MAKNALPDELSLEEVQALSAQGKLTQAAAPPPPDEMTFEQAQAMGMSAAPLTGREKFETGLRSGMAGLTLGISEPIQSASNALDMAIQQALADGSLDALGLDNLKQNYGIDVERRRQLIERAPGLDMAGQVVGGVAPMLMTGGASLAGQIGVRGAATAIKAAKATQALDVGGNVAARVAAMAAKPVEAGLAALPKNMIGNTARAVGEVGVAAGKGTIGAVTQEAARQEVLKDTGFMQEGEAPALDDVAKMGGVIGGGLGAVGKIASAAKVLGKNAASSFLGAKPDTMKRFVDNYETIKNAPKKEAIAEAAVDQVKTIKSVAAKTELDLSQDVTDQLDALKGRTVKSSGEAFEVLEASNKSFPTSDVIGAINKEQKALMVDGALIGDESKSAYNYLERLKSDVSGIGSEIKAPSMKQIIQKLDADADYAAKQSSSTINNSIKSSRYSIDQMVKKAIPEYAEKMKEVSALSDLHARVWKEFGGSEQKALAATRKALSEKNPITTALLDEFAKAQPLALEQTRAARAASDTINRLTEDNIGNRVLAYMEGRGSPEAQDMMAKLGAMSGEDFVKNIEAVRMNSMFDKEFINGSRNVNLWTVMLGATATAIGGLPIGALAALVGAVAGANVDKFGPKLTRQILSGIAEIKGIPTVAKIRALSIPEEVKDVMVQDFIRTMRPMINEDKIDTRPEMNSFYVPDKGKDGVRKEIMNARGLSPEEMADMLIELEKEGKVSGFDRVMFARADRPSKSPIPKIEKKKPVAAELATQYYKFKKEEKY